MNINETRTKCLSILNPNLRTVRYLNADPEDTTIVTMVRTMTGGGYIDLADIAALVANDYIETVPVETPQYAKDYGRTVVAYRILNRVTAA
jgi:hypothetical protein